MRNLRAIRTIYEMPDLPVSFRTETRSDDESGQDHLCVIYASFSPDMRHLYVM